MVVFDSRHEEVMARNLFREANDAFFIFRPDTHQVVDANPTAQRLTSFNRHELCNLPLDELFTANESAAIEDLVHAARDPHFFHSREGYFLRRKDRPPLAVNVSVSQVPSEPKPLGLIVARDVHERKRLVESLQLLKFSVDQSSIATFWIGQDARILHVNQACCRLLAYSQEELLQLRVYDIAPDCLPERCPRYWHDLKKRGSKTFISRLRARNGRLIPVEITAKHLDYAGEEIQFSYVQDISERVRADDERRRLEERVQQAQKLESLGVMAGGIAHDFNNRLTVILGNALLAQGQLDDPHAIAPHLHEIIAAGKNAAELCLHLLAFTGKCNLALANVSLNPLVDGLEKSLPAAPPSNVTFRHVLADPSPILQADERQLRQALLHLLINATEALGAAGGTITLTTGVMHADRALLDRAALGAGLPEGPCAFVEVADTGCGIDPAMRDKIFEPFFSTKFIGRGLGLSFVFGIMRGHRGAIEVTSQVGQGSTFRLLFPLPPSTEKIATESPTAASAPAPTKGTVLVVDDEPAVRELVRHVLAQEGYGYFLAGDGAEAVQIFQEHHRDIDLVLLDLTMPRLGGEATFHQLRAINPSVRVLLCTGYDAQQAANRLLVQGIYGVLQKPYTPSQLLDLVQSVLLPAVT